MNRHNLYLAAGLALLIACGGDRYELKQDKFGRTVRLDKRTGEVVILEGDTLRKVRSEEELAADQKEAEVRAAALSKPKLWPPTDFPQIGVTSAELTTSWRDGRLLYRLNLSPVPKGYATFRSRLGMSPFTLIFHDQNAFQILEEPIPPGSTTTIVDDNDKPLSLSINGEVQCDQVKYGDLKFWTLTWQL